MTLGGLVFACAAETETGLGSRRLRRPVPAAGSTEVHDETDTENSTTSDPGNPNSDAKPAPPATPGTAADTFSVALANAQISLGLLEEMELSVTVTGKGDAAGSVDLSVTGLPTGVTASSATATLSGSAPATVRVKLKAAVDVPVSGQGKSTPIVVTGRMGGATATANAQLSIAPRLRLVVPINADALRAASVQYRDEWGDGLGAQQKTLQTQRGNGIVVTVFNADSRPHIIHGERGFAHGDVGNPVAPNSMEMQNGSPRLRTLDVGANANGYLHDGQNGSGASFRIRVADTQ
jgi:hypothetical protein